MDRGIFFSIVTPTIDRSCLPVCIESVNKQTMSDWEHVIIMDGDFKVQGLGSRYRHYFVTGKCYNNYGNTPRAIGVERARGKYIVYMDDDIVWNRDYLRLLYEALVLKENANTIWGVTNMLRFGEDFLNIPPGINRTDINQVFHKRKLSNEIVRFPKEDAQNTDGVFVERLKAISDPLVVRFSRPKIIYKKMNYGKYF